MSKSKIALTDSADLRFISSLPLDEAVQVLAALAAPDTPVTLTEVDSDRWRFAIGYYEPGQKRASITIVGVLRRWDGTYTRLDCTSRIHWREMTLTGEPVPAGGWIALYVIGLLFTLLLYTGSGDPIGKLIAILTMILLSGLLFFALRHRRMPEGTLDPIFADRFLYHKRQQMFEDIQRVFRLAGDVSQDEDDLDASDDPGLNAVLDRDATGEHRKIQYRR
jgi:hypothetical protein